VRQAAASALGQIRDARAVEPLIAALKDQDRAVRRAAAGALVQIGARAVEPLIAALRDDYWAVRRAAAEALGQIGDAPAVEPLIAALKDSAGAVRRAAAEALGQIGDAPAVEPLIAALMDQGYNHSVYQAAAGALVQIGAPAVEPLIAALKDQDRAVRKAAAKVLVDIYRSGKLEPKKRSPVLAQRSAITELGVAFPD
jgi:HEAT repeat protein